jgi:hypothetical protein
MSVKTADLAPAGSQLDVVLDDWGQNIYGSSRFSKPSNGQTIVDSPRDYRRHR